MLLDLAAHGGWGGGGGDHQHACACVRPVCMKLNVIWLGEKKEIESVYCRVVVMLTCRAASLFLCEQTQRWLICTSGMSDQPGVTFSLRAATS